MKGNNANVRLIYLSNNNTINSLLTRLVIIYEKYRLNNCNAKSYLANTKNNTVKFRLHHCHHNNIIQNISSSLP